MSGKAPNVAGIDFDGYTGGFLVGTALALATESNKIGVVEASEEGASAEWLRGVKEGSAYINKDCQVLSMNTGSWDDASKAKQAVDSLESQGVDAVTENCDAAGAGAVEECDALGLINVGWNNDYSQYGKSCMYKEMKRDLEEGRVPERDGNDEAEEDENVKEKVICPECGQPLSHEGGCVVCKNCGWSKCF